MWITEEIRKEEQITQRNLRECSAEDRGCVAFLGGMPCQPPEKENYPEYWRRGWQQAEEQSRNPSSFIYQQTH